MCRNNSIIQLILALIIVGGVAIIVMSLFQGTKKEVQVVVTDSKIEIKGQYGTDIDIKDIQDIKLVDTIPTIGKKVNGAGLGEFKKGDFDVEGLGTCRLFLHSEEGPFICIITDKKYTIINFKDASKTASVHEELKKVLK